MCCSSMRDANSLSWCKAAALFGGALAAYLLGPHFIVTQARITERVPVPEGNSESDSESDHEYIVNYDRVEDRPLVPWFAYPSDPHVPKLASSLPEAKLSIMD